MALTGLQRDVCRLIADNRIASGESYAAGGAGLNEVMAATRASRDIDLFHDTDEALEATYVGDAAPLRADLSSGSVRFHPGSIRGALPRIVR